MRPLYDARVSDLGPDDFLQVECAYGHLEHLTAAMLTTAGVGPDQKVLDLKAKLKCRECRWKGRALVSIKWGQGSL
jgi:hypothetical protein